MRSLAAALLLLAASAAAHPPSREGFVVTPAMEAAMTRDGRRVYDSPLAWLGWDLRNGNYEFTGLALAAAKQKLAQFKAECGGERVSSCEGLDRLQAWIAWLGSHAPYADECVEESLPGAFDAVRRAASELAGLELRVSYRVLQDLPDAVAQYRGERGSSEGVVLIDRDEFCRRPPDGRLVALSHEFGHAISYARKSPALYSLVPVCIQFGIFGCSRSLIASGGFDAWSLRQAEVEGSAYGMLIWKRLGRDLGDFRAAFPANADQAGMVAEHLRRAERLSKSLEALKPEAP